MTSFCLLLSWVLCEGAHFTENMYVLEKGEYSNKEAMGLASSDTAIHSIQRIGHVSTVDSPQMANHVGHDDHSLFRSGLGAFSALLRPLQ